MQSNNVSKWVGPCPQIRPTKIMSIFGRICSRFEIRIQIFIMLNVNPFCLQKMSRPSKIADFIPEKPLKYMRQISKSAKKTSPKKSTNFLGGLVATPSLSAQPRQDGHGEKSQEGGAEVQQRRSGAGLPVPGMGIPWGIPWGCPIDV